MKPSMQSALALMQPRSIRFIALMMVHVVWLVHTSDNPLQFPSRHEWNEMFAFTVLCIVKHTMALGDFSGVRIRCRNKAKVQDAILSVAACDVV